MNCAIRFAMWFQIKIIEIYYSENWIGQRPLIGPIRKWRKKYSYTVSVLFCTTIN